MNGINGKMLKIVTNVITVITVILGFCQLYYWISNDPLMYLLSAMTTIGFQIFQGYATFGETMFIKSAYALGIMNIMLMAALLSALGPLWGAVASIMAGFIMSKIWAKSALAALK